MSQQYKDPLPSLKNRDLSTIDYDTDIENDREFFPSILKKAKAYKKFRRVPLPAIEL